MKDPLPWPPRLEDLNPENLNYPEKLEQLIDAIFKNQPDRLKLCIMQYLIYSVTLGRVKTPKKVLLPSIVKNLTKNTELINILNRLGHGICYTLLMEIQTKEAYRLSEQQLNEGMIIPEDCLTEQFTIFVADNIDRQEKTLSGMHEMLYQ